MTTKKRNKLLLKIGIACTAFLAFLTCLVTPTFAYTLSNDYVYSSNGLNIENPSNITYTYADLDYLSNKNSEIWIIPESDDNNLAHEFMVEIYEGTTRREIIYRTNINESNSWDFQAIDITNGQSISTMRNLFNDYRIRFSRNGHAADDYIEYKISDILDYYNQFIPLNKYFSRFGVTFYVRSINVAVPGSINIDHVGVYFANDKPTANTFEPYGIYGDTTSTIINADSYNDGLRDGRLESQATIENLNDELDAKQVVIDHLNNENNILTQQLNNLNGTWQSVFFSMVDIPFLTASKALGFELFGLNLYRAFIGILTVLAIFFVFRKISGK